MTKTKLTGKPVHIVIQGDAKTKSYYALILNPAHTINYAMTGKYKEIGTLMSAVKKWAAKEGVTGLEWDSKLKK